MRTALFIVLALSAIAMADIDTCNLGTYMVAGYSMYNLAPYQKNDPSDGIWTATSNTTGTNTLNFSICHALVNPCDNSSTKEFGNFFSGPSCEDVSVDAAMASNPLDTTNPADGIQLVYPSYTNPSNSITYQVFINISCDSGASSSDTIPQFKYVTSQSGSSLNITAFHSSYYGCAYANLGELVAFMQKYKAIFVIIFVVVGIFLAFFGLKLFKVAIFVISAVGGFFLSGVLFYQFASYGSAAWVTWLLFFVCLIIGLVLGYITVKFEKVGFFGIGMVLGVMGFFLLYATILKTFVNFTKAVSYIIAGACGLIGGGLALWIYKDILIIATAFTGSFLAVASVFSYIPNVPSISDLMNGTQAWNALAIVQLAAIAIICIAGIYVQFKNKKNEEDENQEGDTNQLYKNMAGDANY